MKGCLTQEVKIEVSLVVCLPMSISFPLPINPLPCAVHLGPLRIQTHKLWGWHGKSHPISTAYVLSCSWEQAWVHASVVLGRDEWLLFLFQTQKMSGNSYPNNHLLSFSCLLEKHKCVASMGIGSGNQIKPLFFSCSHLLSWAWNDSNHSLNAKCPDISNLKVLRQQSWESPLLVWEPWDLVVGRGNYARQDRLIPELADGSFLWSVVMALDDFPGTCHSVRLNCEALCPRSHWDSPCQSHSFHAQFRVL